MNTLTYEQGCALILEKMRASRPTLREYLKQKCAGAQKSYDGWNKSHPNCEQASYRSGMWYAYRDIQRMLERDEFKPE